jgi:hypothetical protein
MTLIKFIFDRTFESISSNENQPSFVEVTLVELDESFFKFLDKSSISLKNSQNTKINQKVLNDLINNLLIHKEYLEKTGSIEEDLESMIDFVL